MTKNGFTLGELLKRRARFSPCHEALVGPRRRLNFEEFNHISNQIGHYLLEQGIQPGDRVALLACTNFHFSLLYFAAAKVGAITVGLNWRLTPAELNRILDDCQPRIIFYDDLYADLVDNLTLHPSTQTVRALYHYDLDPAFTKAYAIHPTTEPEVEVDPDEPVVLTYTSGTTGAPKGVMITHRNLYEAGVMNSCTLQQQMGDRMLYITPLCHITGTGMLAYQPMIGLTYVFMPQFDPAKYMDLLDKERITHSLLVPGLLRLLFPLFLESDKEFGSFKEFISGGSSVPSDVIRQYEALGFNITQCYASTEALFISLWNVSMGMEHCHTVGKSFLGELKVVDPVTREELPQGEIGEIAVSSPMLFKGYWNQPEETAKVLVDGWLYTGDAGRFDKDNYLEIVDRYKDVIHCSGGEKIYPAEVEQVILGVDDVVEVALIGVKHEVWNEIPRAYVVKKPDSLLTETDVLDYAHAKLAEYKLMEVTFVEQLPRNAFGKVMKAVLREQANANRGQAHT
ncbi:class I adenylate-forming enzyme family protein [Laceyella putida]|uniref:Class I adenylate-forming enzyme family protein n=1 Tax=Laceyella putida TaxID=110101 RepID=A0ABW2RFP4_9BACL